MASQESRVLSDMYQQWVAGMAQNPDMSIDEIRRVFEHWGDVTAEPGGVDYIETTDSPVPCLWAKPKMADPSRVLLCMHGGGYSFASMYSHRKMFAHVARAVGCAALIVDYRRSPEHPHPTPVNDCTDVYHWLLGQGIKPEHMALTGDSAGGALAITTLLCARARGLPLAAASVPMSPWLDMKLTGASLESNAERDYFVKRAMLETMTPVFLGGASPQDPLANPLYADLAGLPAFYLQTGTAETLLDDSRRFVAKVQAAGGEARLDLYPDMQHVFHMLAGTAPEADQAIADLAAWLRPRLGLV